MIPREHEELNALLERTGWTEETLLLLILDWMPSRAYLDLLVHLERVAEEEEGAE